MNVIRVATDLHRVTLVIRTNTGDIAEQFRLDGIVYGMLTMPGTEDKMNIVPDQ